MSEKVLKELNDRQVAGITEAADRLGNADAKAKLLESRLNAAIEERQSAQQALQNLIGIILDEDPPKGLRLDRDKKALVMEETENG